MSNTTLNQPPWEDDELSYGTKLVASLFAIIWIFVVLGAAIYFLVLLFPVRPPKGTTPQTPIVALIVTLIVVVGGIFIFIKWLYPYTKRPTGFIPRNFVFAPDQMGQAFQVQFLRARGRTFGNRGEVRFGERGLMINGTLPPPAGIQVLVILGVTILPFIIFRIGLGLIPAIILAQYIGRESASIQIPYQDMQLVPKGRTITITAMNYLPKNIKFRLATTDGERFYRELDPNKQITSTPGQPVLPPSPANPLNY